MLLFTAPVGTATTVRAHHINYVYACTRYTFCCRRATVCRGRLFAPGGDGSPLRAIWAGRQIGGHFHTSASYIPPTCHHACLPTPPLTFLPCHFAFLSTWMGSGFTFSSLHTTFRDLITARHASFTLQHLFYTARTPPARTFPRRLYAPLHRFIRHFGGRLPSCCYTYLPLDIYVRAIPLT